MNSLSLLKHKRRAVFPLLRLLAGPVLALSLIAAPAQATDMNKTINVAFPIDITGFDPQATSDLYSNFVNRAVFDPLYHFSYLERPAKIIPILADGMPEITDEGRTWTIKLRRGIHFAPDAAFGGKKRELVAADVVFAWKRLLDPKIISPYAWLLDGLIVGAEEHLEAAKKSGSFDYDREWSGLRVLDRYTFQVKFKAPNYLIQEYMMLPAMAPVAREVIDKYKDPGNRAMMNPVGTGPYVMKQWVRGSKIVLEANPNYREEYFPTVGEASDAAIIERNKGKRLPLIGRVEAHIIEETNPRFLSFQQGRLDYLALPFEMTENVVRDGKLLPDFAAKGITHFRSMEPALAYSFFNVDDPVVGGYTPEKIALRRAIIMAFNADDMVRVIYRNQAVPASQVIPPMLTGHDPNVKNVNSYDLEMAKALLDRFGYKDVNGDGYRELPDGKPLLITKDATPTDRDIDELWKKSMDAIGINIRFNVQKWPDLLKQAKAGQFQMWSIGWNSSTPDGSSFLNLLHGKNVGQSNLSRFNLKEFNENFDRAQTIAPGPERTAIYRSLNELANVYSVWHPGVYRIENLIVQPWVVGYKRHPFQLHWWAYTDIDDSKRSR